MDSIAQALLNIDVGTVANWLGVLGPLGGGAVVILRKFTNRWKSDYIKKLQKDLESDISTDTLFPNIKEFKENLIQVSISTENGSRIFENVAQLVDAYPQKNISILGEPGAGKSFMINRYIIQSINQKSWQKILPTKKLFVLIKLSNIEQGEIIKFIAENLSVKKTITEEVVKKELRKGNIELFLDGYNEIPATTDLEANFSRRLKEFIKNYPKCRVITTCRYSEFPTFLRNSFEVTAEVSALKTEQVNAYFVKILGEKLTSNIDNRTKDLCKNPLMLSMVLYYIHSKDSKDKKTSNIPKYKAELYNEYFNIIYNHQDEKIAGNFKVAKNTYTNILSDFAFFLNNEKFSIRQDDFDTWLNDNYPSEYVNKEELLKLVPLRRTGTRDYDVSFLHQSFQDYFTARYLSKHLSNKAISFEKLEPYFSNIRWHETIMLLAQILDDATPLVEEIVKDRENVKAEKWYLATKCLALSKKTEKTTQIANDLLTFSLHNFKYGEAFRYEVLFALKEIIDKCDKSKYKRQVENAEFWFEKYAHYENEPNNLIHLNIDELLIISRESTTESLVIDALHTIGKLDLNTISTENQKKMLLLYNEKVKTINLSAQLKEQIIICFGKLKNDDCIEYLSTIVTNSNENKYHRALAANSLGQIGNAKAVPCLIEYLKEFTAEYRDSAAWALREIKPDNIIEELFELLDKALKRKDDQYTIGTTLYALGNIKKTEVVPDLLKWYSKLKVTKNVYSPNEKAYIYEDLIFALGELANKEASEVVAEFLKDNDSILRFQAADALGKMNDNKSLLTLEKAAKVEKDKYAKDSIQKAIQLINNI